MEFCLGQLEQAELKSLRSEDEQLRLVGLQLDYACSQMDRTAVNSLMTDLPVRHLGAESDARYGIFTIFDTLVQSKRDPQCLRDMEYLYNDFLKEFKDGVFETEKAILAWEFKVQVCFGLFMGTVDDDDEGTKDKRDVDKLKLAIGTYFGDVKPFDDSDLEISGERAVILYPATCKAGLEKICEMFGEFESKQVKDRKYKKGLSQSPPEKFLVTFLAKHSWDRFVHMTKLMCKMLQFENFGEPALVGMLLRKKEKHESTRLKSLIAQYESVGGTSASWDKLILDRELTNHEKISIESIVQVQKQAVAAENRKEPGRKSKGDYSDGEDEGDAKGRSKKRSRKHKAGYQGENDDNSEATLPFDAEDIVRSAGTKKTRKRANPWTKQETQILVEGVQLHGLGKWSIILEQFREHFEPTGRTPLALKDKWRNLENKQRRELGTSIS